MSNILPNGTVLPYGLVSAQGYEASIAGFNRSYKNTGLKAGFVVKSYAANDPSNKSQLCTEYDVQTIEQFENKGSTSLLYRNCLSSQGFGSIADFWEYTLREQSYQSKNAPIFRGQDGAIVLIQCLDNIGSKAIVVGTLIHPDRNTNITSTAPQLSGEYNGVNVEVQNDGSCSLTFKGTTDSKGIPTDSSQGNTEFRIEKDGSFQFNHSTITIRSDRSGVLTITAKSDGDINIGGNANIIVSGNTNITTTGNTTVTTTGDTSVATKGNTKVTTSGNTDVVTSGTANFIAQGITTVDGSIIKLGKNAVESVIKGNTFAQIFNNHTHLGNLGVPTGPSMQPADPSLSKHTFTE